VGGTWPEIEADESLTSNRPSLVRLDTRHRRRVTAQIRRLAGVSRSPPRVSNLGRPALLLLESPSIPWITTTGRWRRSAWIRAGFAVYKQVERNR
jgi:hypothetical protein